MKRALEFHDSIVGSVRISEGDLVVEFSDAYVHESEGEPGVSPGNGYSQAVTLALEGAQATEEPELKGRLSSGALTVRGHRINLVPLPFRASGQIVAEFEFESGQKVRITATGISAIAHGEATWVEAYGG